MAMFLAAVTVFSTALGGILALKNRDRFHLVLGLSAGLLLGLVGFDLLPEVFGEITSNFLRVPTVSALILIGFLLLHILERGFGHHEPAESDYGHDHSHESLTGTLGAIALGGHIFLDGVGLAVAFQFSNKLGFAVFLATLIHAFSDGLNTVSMLAKNSQAKGIIPKLLTLDAIARLAGAAVGTYFAVSDQFIIGYLALFSGMVIYIATSHILPEAHSRHPSRWTLGATIAGVIIMWLIVAA